jgi:hypothetical protein
MLCEGDQAPKLRKSEAQDAKVLQEQANKWIHDNSVQGIAVSTKKVDGRDSKIPCISIYVNKKLPINKLENPIPKKIILPHSQAEYFIDVEEIGQLSLHNDLKTRNRPIFPGLSIGNTERLPGTLGLIVKPLKNGHDDDLYILSCSHVLSPIFDDNKRNILQPAKGDGGELLDDFEIASFIKKIPMYSSIKGNPNRFDAAIAKLNPNISIRADIPNIGPIKGVTARVQKGSHVRIYGKESKLSSGTVINSDFKTRLAYPTRNGGTVKLGFRNLVLCSKYAQPGDSGSAVIGPTNKLMGLHMAGSNTHSIFCRVLPVLTSFGVWPVSSFT